ncbi:hypothetical protein D9619_002325 [Psilocybe cf. subviscida]|uniref:Uncharacterized protein n=1 Tax=Psilocybe cf. subviscida TaxID=2480587 RepID=A0A8H5EUV9_9AGAR|nr:hypothetical protein D9619_002325 [Psilocybe cf. subviscida]
MSSCLHMTAKVCLLSKAIATQEPFPVGLVALLVKGISTEVNNQYQFVCLSLTPDPPLRNGTRLLKPYEPYFVSRQHLSKYDDHGCAHNATVTIDRNWTHNEYTKFFAGLFPQPCAHISARLSAAKPDPAPQCALLRCSKEGWAVFPALRPTGEDLFAGRAARKESAGQYIVISQTKGVSDSVVDSWKELPDNDSEECDNGARSEDGLLQLYDFDMSEAVDAEDLPAKKVCSISEHTRSRQSGSKRSQNPDDECDVKPIIKKPKAKRYMGAHQRATDRHCCCIVYLNFITPLCYGLAYLVDNRRRAGEGQRRDVEVAVSDVQSATRMTVATANAAEETQSGGMMRTRTHDFVVVSHAVNHWPQWDVLSDNLSEMLSSLHIPEEMLHAEKATKRAAPANSNLEYPPSPSKRARPRKRRAAAEPRKHDFGHLSTT